jgi:hypothetical protein
MNFYCMTVCLCITTLTEVFPCFFLSCKANARVMPAKTGHGPQFSYFFVALCIFCIALCIFCVVLCDVCFVTFPVLFVCICVLNTCHRVVTQLQLNISYHIFHDQTSHRQVHRAHTHTHTHTHIDNIQPHTE